MAADFILNGISFYCICCWDDRVAFFFRNTWYCIKDSIIRGINKYLGTVAGAIYGFVVVWIAFYVIALCSTSEVGGALIRIYMKVRFLHIYMKTI